MRKTTKIFLWGITTALLLYAVFFYIPGKNIRIAGTPFASLGNTRSSSSSIQSDSQPITEMIKENLDQGVGQIANISQQGVGATKNSIGNTSQSFLNTVSNFTEGMKEGVRGQLATILGLTTPTNGSNVISATPPFEVCPTQKTGERLDYLILNPSQSLESFKYKIDWGDGTQLQDTAQQGTKEQPVSHTYNLVGIHPITFQITTPSSTLTVERNVCIE